MSFAPALSPSQASLLLVESARYALLRRLAFAMRHQMVVYLQPIGMVSEVLERRLKAAEPNLVQVHESMAKIQGFSKQAAAACLEVITWMAPPPTAMATVDAAVREIVDLLRSHFSFRSFQLRAELEPMPQQVHKGAARMLLAGCLLALTDTAAAPAEVRVTVTPGDDEQVLVEIRLVPTEGTAGFAGEPPYRLLQWHEVEAMARSEGMALERGDGWVRLTMPVSAPA